MATIVDPTVRMSDGLAHRLGCTRVPFDAGGYPCPVMPTLATFIVQTHGGAWCFWDFVPDEIARVCNND